MQAVIYFSSNIWKLKGIRNFKFIDFPSSSGKREGKKRRV